MQRLTIETLAHGGDSVARLEDGRAAFIAGGCPGDVVLAEITEEHERYARGRVTEVIEPSPDRVVPPCPYFGVCGGCQWQHVSYELQLASKRGLVTDALERIGGFAGVEVDECVPSVREYGYRNKIELLSGNDAQGRLVLGFAAANSHTVVPVDACMLLPSRHAKLPKALSGSLRYISGNSDLGISRVAARVSERTRDLEIALWTSPGAFPRKAVGATLKEATRASSIVRVLYRGETKRRAIAGVEVLSGKGFWRERLGEYEYVISAPTFFQVNTATAEKLVDLVLAAIEPDGSDRVLDLYSGAGTFTLPLSELASDVVAVEAEGSSVKDLRRNLDSAGSWAEVAPGEASRALPELGAFDAAIVDPPRAGLHESVVSALVESGPERIAYVSCDPATLARDAKRLAESSYRLTSATPVDLFPQTWHVETVARFERVR